MNDTFEIDSLNARLSDVERRLNNLLRAMEQGAITETTTARAKELEALKQELRRNIASHQLMTPTITKEEVVAFIMSYKKGSLRDSEYCQKLINTFVTKVYVYDDHGVIFYDAAEGENTIEIPITDAWCKCSNNAMYGPPYSFLVEHGQLLLRFSMQ